MDPHKKHKSTHQDSQNYARTNSMHSSRHAHEQTSRKCNRFKMGKTLCICKTAHLLCVRHASKESPDANVFHCDTVSPCLGSVCFAVFNRGSFGNIRLRRNLFHTRCSRRCATSKAQFRRLRFSRDCSAGFFYTFFSPLEQYPKKAANKCRINITIMPITGLPCRHTWSIQFHPNPTL